MSAPLVLVSGVSGYIGAWCAYVCLAAGYRVRGTVRSVANDSKVAHLKDLCPGSKHKIELVEADLMQDAGWKEACEGCTYVLHVASPFTINNPKDENVLIRPAVDGTLRVLRAATAAEVQRVVVTSSVASVAYGTRPKNGSSYTEADWTDPTQPVGAYVKSKVLAERAAWDYVGSLEGGKKIELATVNPVLVLGPTLGGAVASGSAEIIEQLMLRKMPRAPQMPINFVDVREVALAHLAAMAIPEAAGKRFIACGGSGPPPGCPTLVDFGTALANEFRSYGYNPVTGSIPNFVITCASIFSAVARSAKVSIQNPVTVLTENSEKILDIKYETDYRGMTVELARSLIASGVIPDLSPEKALSKQLDPHTLAAPIAERLKRFSVSQF